MKIELLLLDFDGTVANTGRANAVSYIEALAEEGITITMEEYRQKYFGLRCPEFLSDIGITDPVQMQRIRRRKVEIYPTHFDLVALNKPLWAGFSRKGWQGDDCLNRTHRQYYKRDALLGHRKGYRRTTII